LVFFKFAAFIQENMKISLNWLKDYITIQEPVETIADLLTQIGLEVEGIEQGPSVPGGLEGLVIGEVLVCEKHPNADKLKVTEVSIGTKEPLAIVCGAPNVRIGQKVVVAPVGTTIYPVNHEPLKMKKAKIRGEVSEGMICAEDEIGVGESHDGILVLETDLPNGTPAKTFFNIEEEITLEIGLTPNRADAASHIGVARDLKAVLGGELKWPDVSNFEVDNDKLKIPVIVENTEACPRYSAVTISGVKVGPSPDWLQNRLKSIGSTPINNVVDVTNYVLHELGQPLHAFNADAITGGEVIVKTLPKGSTFVTLDEKERKLEPNDLMICNSRDGMCLAGVFGGIHSGVSEKTTNVFLESAYFNPDFIRKTAQHHGLKTDAAFRYERGTDPNITVYALKRAAMMIKDIAGGTISSEIIDVKSSDFERFQVEMKYSNITRLIGKDIGKEKIHTILDSLDITIQNTHEDGFMALVPPYRVDVTREADVIEEILRIYGLNNIELDEGAGTDFISTFDSWDEDGSKIRIGEMLSANGYNEIITNSLSNIKFAQNEDWINSDQTINIQNKLSEELGVMRQTPIFSGLEVIQYNVNRRLQDLRVYEWAKTYATIDGKLKETEYLSLYLTGDYITESWFENKRRTQFHDLLGTTNKVLSKLGIDDYSTDFLSEGPFQYGLSLSSANEIFARIGRLKTAVTEQVALESELFYAELNWKILKNLRRKQIKFQEIPKFPSVRRDLSLVLDKNVNFQEVKEVALKYSNKLLEDIRVFDVYEGKPLNDNQKAYALSFILQDPEKTLTDKVIDKTMNKLMAAFEKELSALIRK
jgi:phenylalanyl-tRNA synthetase beta chain